MGSLPFSKILLVNYGADTVLSKGPKAETAKERSRSAIQNYDFVRNRKGIFEYLLGGSTNPILLDVRVFETPVKRAAYEKQTQASETKGESNCPLCAVGHDANKSRIYRFEEMEADHVSAWSTGGGTKPENCQMLCVTHNRAKGNR